MPLYNLFNARMQRVGYVDAVSEVDALKHAKRMYPGAVVERVLTEGERRQKQYEDECKIWDEVNAMARR